MIFKSIWLVLFGVSCAVASAQVVLSNDLPYKQFRHNGVLYIYNEEIRSIIPEIDAWTSLFRENYEKSYQWRLDEDLDLVLASPRQQIANAYATVMPNLKSVWFPSGAGMVEEMAEASWATTLASHEIAHLYQLNTKAPVSSAFKTVVGNAVMAYPFVWPVFIHPNIFTPGSLLEGNAVLAESRINVGGRLHSGEKRALAFNQIAAGRMDSSRLINDQLRFPFGEANYILGGYFQAYLAEKYGVDKTHAFFSAQAQHYLVPLILNKTFRKHFGASYPQVMREFLRKLKPAAEKQKFTDAKPLVNTLYVGDLNQDATHIWFLATNARENPKLFRFQKSTGQLSRAEQADFLMGKVFYVGGEPETAAAFQHSLDVLEYSLYGKNARFDENYRGQIVTDIRAGQVASLDASQSWLEPKLLRNSQPYDVAHSSAIFDEAGRLYYFRQNGLNRVLYRDREPVFQYQGFYGKVMEADLDGSIYFIANTGLGSSLYRYRGQVIEKIIESDLIVQARKIDENRFLVVELRPEGHQVLIAHALPQVVQPSVYKYGFESITPTPQKSLSEQDVANGERSYSGVRELRYSATDLQLYLGSYFTAVAQTYFTDPLQFHTVAFAGQYSTDHYDAVMAQYIYSRWRPEVFANYFYQRDPYYRAGKNDGNSEDQVVRAGLSWPLFKHQRWVSALSLSGFYEREEDPVYTWKNGSYSYIVDTDETVGSRADWTLAYQVSPWLGFWPWRSWTLAATQITKADSTHWRKQENISFLQTHGHYGFERQVFVSGSGFYAWAEDRDIEVEYQPYSFGEVLTIPLMTSRYYYDAKAVGSARLEFSKVFDWSAYSPRFPVGLHRLAPFVAAQETFFDRSHGADYPADLFEFGYGADIDLLLFHRLNARTRFLRAFNTRYPEDTENQLSLGFKRDF